MLSVIKIGEDQGCPAFKVRVGHGIVVYTAFDKDATISDMFEGLKKEVSYYLYRMWHQRHIYTPEQVELLKSACAEHDVETSTEQ